MKILRVPFLLLAGCQCCWTELRVMTDPNVVRLRILWRKGGLASEVPTNKLHREMIRDYWIRDGSPATCLRMPSDHCSPSARGQMAHPAAERQHRDAMEAEERPRDQVRREVF